MFENWKILKSEYEQHEVEYAVVAYWCTITQQYTIIEDGEYYKVVKIEVEE